MNKINLRVFAVTLLSVLLLNVADVFAGTGYTHGRAFLKQGSPAAGGKVYVASNATEPTSGQYKAVTSTTSPAFDVKLASDATFHYWAAANPGYIFTGWYTYEGTLVSSGAAHISKKLTQPQAGGSDTHSYADYYASFIKQIQMSFVEPTNGSFTITHNGAAVTPAYSSFTTEGKVVLTALPADGYKLRGWYTTTNGGATKNYFAFGSTCEPNFTSNVTIGADFVPDNGKATFWIKGTNNIYDDLGAANTAAASSSSKMIVVVSDGLVVPGTYTISSGVTLLIPCNELYENMTTPKVMHYTSSTAAPALSAFRKLTLSPGATINVSGKICIAGQQTAVNGGNPTSQPCGPVGVLDMSRGGTINLNNGSVLYAWGFVKGQDMDQGNNTTASGVGEINANAYSTVWEDFQCGEWRGGTASSTIYDKKSSWKFFPFQSYTIQNIEAPVNYAYNSNLKCHWAIFGNGTTYTVPFELIKTATSGAFFNLTAAGATVRKWYDPTTDRVCFELGGASKIDELTLSVMGETVKSSDYNLPIPANLHIALKSGCALTLAKPMTVHAGAVVEVKNGATLNVNAKVYMYDADDWDMYCMYSYYYRTYNNLTLHYNRGTGTSKATLEDATLIVDGTVNIGAQNLYVTAHGANICGNGGGTLKYAALPSNTTMTQCKQLSDAVTVNIRSANMHNDNGTYTKGVASTTFKNVHGRWFTNAKATEKANHTYDFTYIKSGDVYGTGGTNGTVSACWSKDKTGLELQDKWANIQAEGCTNWWTGIDDSHLYNWTRNSAWHQYIKTGSTTTGSGEEAVTTDTYVGSDGKMLYKTDCEFVDAGSIDGNCLYPSNKALVNGSLIAVTANTSPDHGYHKSDAASTYYLCFEGCVWHPATKNAENLYTVDGTKYIWYGDKWMAVEYDSGVSLHYSLSATNVKIYYDYVDHAWVLATPVAEVVTSAGTEQVFSLANAITKAKAGGTNVTIRLLKNISGTISYDGTNNCGLDLNGFTLSSSTSGMITVNSATATFIIKDQSAAGTGKVQLSYSANARRYAISVTKGHLVVNSGTISAINTMAYNSSSAKTVDVGAITVAAGHKVTVNGGSIEAISDHNPYGIYLAGATAMATINGGTIEAKTTERSSSVDSPYGIIGAGSIYVNGGTVKATCYRSSSSRGISSSGTFTMTGGSVIATASSTCYGVYAASGSNTTISGGTLTATAGGSDAKGIYVAGGTTTVNTGATVSASATTNAYGIYYADGTPTVTVNGGAFTVSTTSTTGAYGVYAAKGTGTINDGTFTVTAKTTGAEGMHVETANTPKLTLNGGKFMVKNSNGSANGTINNTGATLANFSMAGGYFNIAPNGTTNIAAGKSVQDVVREKEQAIYDAGYVKKIRGNEYTVTWKNYNGTTLLGTTQVESGKVPVWTGETPTYNTSTTTREFDGWSTQAKNKGDTYLDGAALPVVDADNVTYYAHYDVIYAEVIAGGTTTRYTSARTAWTNALKNKNATIRVLSNYATTYQMVFNPTNANSTITLDLNGHYWADNGTRGKQYLLDVNPTQTGCKLIITDNSASGKGYLQNSFAKTDGDLRCVFVQKGELVLQGGGLKVYNTAPIDSAKYSNAVYVSGNNARFTMTGGTVYSTDSVSPRAICVGNGYADIAGGTVEAKSIIGEAYALLCYDTVNVSADAVIKATGTAGSAYGLYCNGASAILTVDSCTVESKGTAYALGIRAYNGGTIVVDGNPTVSSTATTGSGAYGVYSTGTNSNITVNSGTFTVKAATSAARGLYTESSGAITVKDGSFTVTSELDGDPSSFGAYVAGGTINIEGGNFTLNVVKANQNADLVRCGPYATAYLNVSGGTFTSEKGFYGVRSFGGETTVTGNPVFTAHRGIGAGEWASATGTAKVTIDGGTYNCTVGYALLSTTHTHGTTGDVVTGDVTVLDGRFHTLSSVQPVDASKSTDYLKIKGGYFTSYTSSNVSNLNKYVVAPSYTTAVESTDPMYASPNDYRYRVNTKFTVTWKDMAGNTLKTEQYNRNEIPSYGSEYIPSDGNTYEFNGWSPTPGPIQSDQIYTAQYTKYEAEVTVPGETGSKRYTSFMTAFNEAQNLPVATIKVLSDVYYSAALTLNPDSVGGSKPLTIDLNNHVVNYTPKTATYALTINKAGCKLIIDDSSVAKGGQFGHRQVANDGAAISAIYIQNGELELAGGTIIAQNNNVDSDNKKSLGTRAVVGNSGTVFTQTGGKLYAKSRFDARCYNSGGTGTFNATGGTIEATNEYTESSTTKWGSSAYGVVLWNNGTFNMSGTAVMNVHTGSSAIGAYAYGPTAVANISGGTIATISETSGSRPVYANNSSVVTISGGDFTATGHDGDGWSTEAVSCSGGIINITGGNFHSEHGGNCNAVRVYEGIVTISGNPYFDSRNGIAVGDWATKESCTATVYVNGGTFVCPGYVLYSRQMTNEYNSTEHLSGTVIGTMYVNGGYFKTTGSTICNTSSGTSNLILNGGYYNETSGTTQKSNITTYKGATTEVTTLSPVVHDAYSNEYHYELLTDFNITWFGGGSYSKVTQTKSGVVPTNTELEGKSFLRNDSAFYFTGWSPTPTAVTGDATYNAEGVYHEAKVTVSAQDSIFDNFDEAWAYAMDQANATITLLTNLTRTSSIVYNPAPANARHTLDLNNFTIKENTTDRLLIVNKTGAQLTITDNSSDKGGCLYKKMDSSANISTSVIYHGELILAGGKLYVENTKDDRVWHPAECVHVSRSTDGIFTMTGGTVESQAKYLAYPLYNYATMNISGGTIIANATTQGAAQGLYAVAGTATISGGTWNISSTTSGAVGVAATGWVNTTGTPRENGVLNITGGTFNVSAAISNVQGIKSYATGKRIDGTNYSAHGIVNVSGGTFNVTCSAATATQVFAAHVDAWRLFDNALPHTLLAEARGEMNISGGTFTVDARNNGAWVANSGNVDLLRNWGILNVSGGNFTIHQYRTPSAISVFRGKATVTGNPVFNVYAHTGNAYAVCAGYWTHENYCDKNAANNLAEAEVNGGTYNIITEGQNTNVIYSLGQISAESRDAVADTITAHAGYAMNAKITVNGGTFLGICPNESGKYPIMLNSRVDLVGTYGTAKSEIYVNGGKFKSRKGTSYESSTTTGAVNCHNDVGTLLLTGGYYETNGQLAAQKADTCDIINITSADIDPEYNNGYRYKIAIHYVAQVTATGVDRKFATLKGALDYARTINNSTVTILDDCNFETDGQYGYALGTIGKTMTIDLNNHTVNATNSETSYDRVFAVTGQITITDNSVAKGGKLNLTKAHNGTFLGIVFNDASQLTLANGTIYVENTTASKAVEALNIWGTTGIFRQTGGTLQAKATSATATGIQMRGTAEISGGNVIVTSDGSYARAFVPAADAANSKYGSITVSGTPTITVSGAGEVSGVYANVAGTTTTISGGTWNITSTTSTAYGVRLSKANTATISGGTFNVTATTTNAYGIYVSGGGSGTVSGGTFTSRTGANKNESFGAYATGTGTTLNITGGTFDVNSADNAGSNINVVRVQPGATVTISGGTFRSAATGGNALVSFGGVTTVSGTALFEAYTGAYVGSWYQGDGTNDELATVNLNGGTFNVTGIAINATWNTRYKDGVYLSSPFINSIVNVNGGRYKTTGGTIVQKKADGADGGTAVLNIAGGYFNEKSGTTFKDQIATYVADTSEINTLDPLLDGIYKYEVAPHYVAKVQTGSTTKYHTTAKAAFDYAKTVANPTITLLDNCMLTEANYMINPGNWTGTLDLNNFTLTPTIHAENGRAFTIGGTGTKFIVTDNSVGQGGQIYYKGNSSVSIIYFVVAGGEMELAGGTLYVENTNASKKAIGFVVDGNPSQFTQSAGTFTIKGAYGANGYYGKGTATFTGGTMNVDGGAHQAIGLFPYESTSKLNVSGTFALNVTSSFADSYGVLVKNSGATGTISGGKFKFNQNTIVGAQLDGSLTITGGYFCEHPSQAGRYKSQINSYKGSKVIMDLDAADAEYIAGYRYLVTADPVAKVKAGSEVTYYTSMADAITAANTKTNPTVTMLKNASTTQQTITAAMTLDLNGKTVTSTQASSKKGVFSINASGQTVTITDSGTGGKIDHTASYAGYVYGVALAAGTLNVTGGTIYAKNTHTKDTTTYRAYGIYTAASTTLTISDGTIEAECPNNSYALGIGAVGNLTMTGGTVRASATTVAYGVYANNTSTELSDVTVTTNTTGATSIAIYDRAGHMTVHSGTYTSTGTSSAYAIYAYNVAAAIVDVEGGKFSGTTRELYKGSSSTVSISGGYYVHNTTVKDNCASNHHVLPASLTEGGITYNYKVAEAYTLTWNLDGGTVTTAGTGAAVDATGTPSIVWGVGDAITAPVVTKTGYTFAAWTPAVAATMPAANTTYTATWTINSYTIRFLNYDGSVLQSGSVNYGVTPTYSGSTPTKPNDATYSYNFTGWSPAIAAVSGAQDYTAQFSQTANIVASVAVGGATTYYATLADAFAAANVAAAAPTITVLQDVEGVSEKLTYSGSQNCTLDLNGHTITSTTAFQSPLHINSSGITFTITDGTVDKSGKLSMTSSSTSTIFGAYAENGNLVLEAGTIEVISGTKTTCGVTALTTGTFTMNGGTIHVVATNGQIGRGLYFNGTMTVNSGTIHVEATGDGYGIFRDNSGGTATVNGGKFNITSSSGTPYITNQANNTYMKIYGGYYNIDTQLGKCVSAPYRVFNLTSGVEYDEGYRYKVARFYTITYNKGANGTGTIAAGYKAKDDAFTLSSSTFTRTGYTQTGWSTSDGGAKVYELGGTYSDNADLTVYPFWSAQNYTLTLNNQSATTAGTTSITVTYNSNTNLTATPAITVPTKTGYTFGGYYVDPGGSGKQVIEANGNVNASVSGITDASKNWIVATSGTIYAKWTQTVTLHDNNGGIHNGSLEVTYNSTYKSGTPPTREGYTAEGYYAEPACTNKVLTTAAVWVNYSGWVEGGKWVHDGESTLYTKWIEDTHTVTVAAGANGSASPASVTAGITTASGTITATPNTGYHFDNWTIPAGVTIASGSTTSPSITINATADDLTITANFAANTNTAYTVKHYKQNLAGDGYDLADTDNLTGTTGASVTPAVKSYTGFTAPSTQTKTIAADGSMVIEYQYTRNSYTLTWALDGGSISVAGTPAGSVKYGASLTAPTVTKTGYTFAGWSPEVPSTMPAANTEYTATWTVNSYTIRFLNYDGSVLQSGSVNYGETPVYSGETPTKPTDAIYTYTFDTWSPAITAVSKAQDYTAQFSQTANVASVTVGGATTYYTTLQDAFNYAADKTTPTIQVLSNIALAAKVTYTNTSRTTVTFDLNGHTISGGANGLLTLTSASSTGGLFVIKSSVEGGQIRNVLSSTSARYCVNLSKGKLTLQSGTIYNENTNTGASYAVTGSRAFTMTGGKLHAKAQATAYGAYITGSISTISGGEIKAETSGNTASAVFATGGTTTLKGTIECNISGASNVYGAMAGGANPASDKGTLYNGKLIIEGGTFNVTAGASGTAYGVYSTGGTRNIHYSTSATYAGNYADAGDAEVKGGVFTVKGKNTYGIGSKGTVTISTAKDADGNATYEAASATPKVTVTGGKFDLQGTSTKAAVVATSATITNTDVVIEGGWYNVATNLNKYTAPTKSCNYHVLPLAGESPYAWEVAEAYTLTWDLVGGTVTTAGTVAPVDATGTPNGVVKKGASLTAPVVTKTGYTFTAWTPAVAAKMPSANTTYTATWTPVASLAFVNPGVWSDPANWEPACVPTAAHDVYILKPCSVDIEHAAAKSIVLDQSDSHSGSLTIGANKGLEVVGTINRTTTGEDKLATRPEDLKLETSSTGNATLIFNNSNSNQATVDLYSKGYIDGSGTKNYQYIGVPCEEVSALYNFYGSWMYSWGIKKNGSWGWVSVKNGASVYEWTGYCITQQAPTTYAIEGTLVQTTSKDITVPANENMVVGNSWTAPIDINALTTDDLEGLLANIYFFNTGVDKTGSGSEAEARYTGGTYVTVPIHAAPYKDGDDHINSMQGFFVKNTDKSNEGTLHLNYERHVRGTTRGSIIGDALHAPKHAQAEEPVVLKIKVSGENYDDKLLLLEREDFSTGFDNGWDGDKWDGNESSLYLYTKDSEGTENSVSAIPEMEGTIIGFRAGEDDGYTMHFDYLNSDEPLYLFDIQTRSYTRIETGATYWFLTNDKEKHERFIITRTEGQEIATGLTPNYQSEEAKAKKLLIEDKMFILVNGMLFDATGKIVK